MTVQASGVSNISSKLSEISRTAEPPPSFTRIYSSKFKIDYDKMMTKLWGDNYFDSKAKKWKTDSDADDGSQLKRCFVQFIMEPVIRLCKNCMEG